jgi:cell division inhibitor SepF
MALRDTWHRALVYFGLAEDPSEDELEVYEEPGPDLELEQDFVGRERDRQRPSRRASRARRDDFDDIFADDAPVGRGSRTRVLRPVGNGGSDNVRMHVVVPRNFNDAQQVADYFKRSVPVILNLQTADTELSKRLIDFASGLTYALSGGMQRIADKVFLLTPENVQVSAEEKARLIEKGFFNQS